MRLFSAIVPPEHVRRDVHATLETAREGPRLRWTAPERMHLTLVFLADVPPAHLERVVASVDAAAATVGPFDLELHGLGAFPKPARPRVFVIDVTEGREALGAMHRAQARALADAGVEVEDRPLRPHLTIARPKRPPHREDTEALVRELEPWRWRFRVEQVELIESQLRPEGPLYTVRHATGLSGPRR
ncbi:MAG TPA: RNA 2',3'-cyclic phosphodiesterase [Candidatus Krumholzibacteria bacterium]|nr:RNA 2',3'-cyclic phosphodiesterase [Candidatus Krumholzibacteria bacterium]